MAKGPANRLGGYLHALAEFERAYKAYLEAGPGGPASLRSDVWQAIPAAQEALDSVGGGLMVAPPGGGPPFYSGLENLAFLHEQPGFRLSQPPIFDSVLDSLESAKAKIRRDAERRLHAEEESAAFCKRGHPLGEVATDLAAFCGECGAAKQEGCPGCGGPIGVRPSEPGRPLNFCESCGAAYPWADRQARIYRLENMLSDENLDEATDLAVREQLDALADPDLTAEQQRDRWRKIKEMAPGLTERGGSIIEGLVGAVIRQQIGL